ncbi:uncharacterized protein LOC123014804 [Tribolium madens]|uniref:uncharacterized protein LOC123014804 n=1 Tax=Tribolium madens TaxID=41895 RepID=UPI001CF7407D|nr:uncharacterized protein LOC123014804 [Tribolium madens]
MKILLLVLVSVGFCELIHRESVVRVREEAGPGGVWQTKTQWKAHWVKHWETRKIWIPIWRKVWGPVEVKEWIPLPKPPPSWTPPPS